MALASVHGFPGLGEVHIEAGEAIRIVGPNGSGKTTLLRCLAGLDVHVDASATWGDRRARDVPAEDAAAHVGWLPQDPRDGLVGLTVAGEFRFRGLPAPTDLTGSQDVATLSSGEARRIGLRLTRGKPLLLLDEPLEGLDERGVAIVADRIAAARESGAAVFVDHGDRMAGLADRTIELGTRTPAAPVAWPTPGEGRRLQVPRAEVALDDRRIQLPGVHVGPGVHAVVGPNGSGKTTLLRRIAGLMGEPGRLDDAPLRMGRDVRFLGPHPRDQLVAERVGDLVRDGHGLVPEALMDRHPLTLSGGEARRVALARTLGTEAPLYLLDEPESHLDADGRAAMTDLVAARVRDGAIVLMATHDRTLIDAAHHRIEVPA